MFLVFDFSKKIYLNFWVGRLHLGLDGAGHLAPGISLAFSFSEMVPRRRPVVQCRLQPYKSDFGIFRGASSNRHQMTDGSSQFSEKYKIMTSGFHFRFLFFSLQS